MYYQRKTNAYALSERDFAVMSQANIGFREFAALAVNHAGLPPLWSRIPYLMILHDAGTSRKYFWKIYRQFDELLKTRDSHYRRMCIPKTNGEKRDLLVPDYLLRYHQRYILHNILYKIPVSDYACAYHKHRGLADLAKPHVGHKVLIHLDIKDFFTSITEQMVFEALLKETGYAKPVAGFLSRLCCYCRHLPQGACTSPALSNICFKDCDAQLAGLAQRSGLAYTRYSDDLYFSGDEADAGAFVKEAEQILASHGFQAHNSKTKILGRHKAQMVTAIVVNDKMQVSRQYRRKLRQEIHYLSRFGRNAKAAQEADSYEQYLHQLLGRISFVLYVDPDNQEFLAARDIVNTRIEFGRYSSMPF